MSLFRTKDVKQMIAEHGTHSALRRDLGAFDLIMLGIGAIIGTGIFVLTGTGAELAGPALTLSFIVAATACGFAALCYAEFASTIPVSGSAYTYAYATMGELIAWVIGWDLVLEYSVTSAAVATGWSGYFQHLLAGNGWHLPDVLTGAYGSRPDVTSYFNLPAFAIMMLITVLLAMGIRASKRFNNIAVVIKVGVVLIFIALGMGHVEPANWQPFMPFGIAGTLSAAAIIFFAFLGFDAVSCAAEEVKNPARDIPFGIIGSLLICTVLYVIVAAIMTGIVPFANFKGVASPVSTALEYAGKPWAAGIIDVGAILGMTTVILVMTYGQTRVFFSMSRDGLLPACFSKIHPRTRTPFNTTIVAGTVIALVAGFVPLRTLAELANIGTLAAFVLCAIAVVILRRTQPDLPRKFRCPAVPLVPILTVLCCVGLMLQLHIVTWLGFGVWFLIGLVVYFSYARQHSALATSNAVTQSASA